MKRISFVLISFVLFYCNTFCQEKLTAPEIISTIPEFGDCQVNPETKEIIIKFDQEMEGGMSVINTRNMPKMAGDSKWIDNKTLSIPVELYQNKLYTLAFNNSRYNNFRNVNGVPLNPDVLHFQTKVVSFTSLNKQSYKELQEIFPKKYSYASLKGIDWESLLEKSRNELEDAETQTEFALKLAKLLRVADDPHMKIEVEGQTFEIGNIKLVHQNFGYKQLFSELQNKIVGKGFKSQVGIIDSTGYISIRSWQTDFFSISHRAWGNSRNPEIPTDSILIEMFKYPNLIIDVRHNSGGNESYAKKFASYFVNDSISYELVKGYNEKTGLFDQEHIKKVYPNGKGLKYTGNVYVLSGPNVMSSNESFILMMKQLPNVKVVGMKTYGTSGNTAPYELSNGVKIYLPSWQAYTLEGKLIEGNGIEPDIELKTTSEDFKETDPVIDEIIELTKKN